MTMAENGCNYGYENHTFSLEGIYSIYLFFTFPHFLPTFSLLGLFIYSASSLKYSLTHAMFPVGADSIILFSKAKKLNGQMT